MLNFTNLFSSSYLFNLNPGPLLPNIYNLLIIIFTFFIITSLLLKIFTKKTPLPTTKKILSQTSKLLTWMSILGLLWIFFRQQLVSFMSSPFWIIIWFIGLIYWGFTIIKNHRDSKPRVAQIEKFKQKQKYLQK